MAGIKSNLFSKERSQNSESLPWCSHRPPTFHDTEEIRIRMPGIWSLFRVANAAIRHRLVFGSEPVEVMPAGP